MLKLGKVTKVKALFLVLVLAFNFDLFKFSTTTLEKGLLFVHKFLENYLKTPPLNQNSVRKVWKIFVC